MTTYKIEYDLSELKNLSEKFAKTIENAPAAALPNTAAAFERAAHYVHNMWTGYLRGEKELNGVDYLDGVTSAMVKSIRARYNGDLDYSISSDNRQLEEIQKGRKEVEYDMKKTHPYGKKSRVSKKGIPYLIIPFRWATPNDKGTMRAHKSVFSSLIPTRIYNTKVKGLDVSKLLTEHDHFEKNARGEDIERFGYEWVKSSRLQDADAWNDRSKGMVKMKDVTGSTYFTFRIISAKSPANSWIYHRPAKPAIDMMGALNRTVKPEIDKMIREGVALDNQLYKNQ